MWGLLSPQVYFRDRTSIKFLPGFVAVFLVGGFSLFTALVGLFWVASSIPGERDSFLNAINVELFAYTFFSGFLLWFITATIFYGFVVWDGRESVDYFSILSVVGLGFIPLAITSCIELIITLIIFANNQPLNAISSAFILISGDYSTTVAGLLYALHGIGLLWTNYVWTGGLIEVGTVSKQKAIIFITMVDVLFILDFVFPVI